MFGVTSYPLSFEASEVYLVQVYPMKEAASLCRPLCPLCQRKVPCNMLQDFFRKAEQLYLLQQENLLVRLYTYVFFVYNLSMERLYQAAHMCRLCKSTSILCKSSSLLERHCRRCDRNSRGKSAHHHTASSH